MSAPRDYVECGRLYAPLSLDEPEVYKVLEANVPMITEETETFVKYYQESKKIEVYGKSLDNVFRAKKRINEALLSKESSEKQPKKPKSDWVRPEKPQERNGFNSSDEIELAKPGSHKPNTHASIVRINAILMGNIQPHQVFTKYNGLDRYLTLFQKERKVEIFYDNNSRSLVIKGHNDEDVHITRERMQNLQDLVLSPRHQELKFYIGKKDKVAKIGFQRVAFSGAPSAIENYFCITSDPINPSNNFISKTCADSIFRDAENALSFLQKLNFLWTLKIHFGKIYAWNIPDSVRKKESTLTEFDENDIKFPIFDRRIRFNLYSVNYAVKQFTEKNSSFPVSLDTSISFEIFGSVPVTMLFDVEDFILLPKTNLTLKQLNDRSNPSKINPASGPEERVGIRITCVHDSSKPSGLGIIKVSVQSWDVLSDILFLPLKTRLSNQSENIKPQDIQLCIETMKELKMEPETNLVARMLFDLIHQNSRLDPSSGAVVFVNNTNQISVKHVLKRISYNYKLNDDLNIIVDDVYKWNYRQVLTQDSAIYSQLENSAARAYVELYLSATRINQRVSDAVKMTGLGEEAKWNFRDVLSENSGVFSHWLNLSSNLAGLIHEIPL